MKISEVLKEKLTPNQLVEEIGNFVVNKLEPNKFIKPIPFTKIAKGKLKEDAIFQLSDLHVGKVNKILNQDTRLLEETYNTSIMIQEANRCVEAIYSINDLLSAKYDVENIWILSQGDLLDNDRIFKGQQFFIDSDIGTQIWVGVQVLSDMINALLKVYKKVHFIGVIGNHGRMCIGREEAPVSSSFDYQLLRILQVMYKNNPRVEVVVPETWDYIVDIKGWKYYIHHGDNVYSVASFPYYGISRQGKARRLEFDFDMELIGHFHTPMTIQMSSKSCTMVNGGWIYHDSYAWKKFGALSTPVQNFFGTSEKRPKTWAFELDLKHEKKLK